jgi:hypothetical protein
MITIISNFAFSLIIKITQRRFLGYGTPTEEEDRVIWNINLGVVTESHSNVCGYIIANVFTS